MRIAFIGQKGIFVRAAGGVETHVENLSLQLVDRGHEVFVYARPHFCFIRRKKYLGVNLIKLPSIPTKNLDTITHTFFSTIHALFCKYDVIHYHGVGPATLAWIARLLKPRTKIVVTFHSIDRFHKKWGWFARLYLGFGEWAACKFPHATIVVSKVLQKYCKKKFDARTTYVPNGVLIPRKPSKEPLEKWGLKPGKYILAVARLVRHKGIHYLIEAYKNLYNKEFLIRQDGFGMTNKIALAMTNGGAKLVIVGAPSFTDDYLDYLKEVAAEDPNVIFTGFQRGATLSALFANAYLYVHPSEAEGLAITILEAMSHGRCVLTSDISENAEAIDDCGVLFKSGDVEDLKDKMVALIKNPKRVKSLGVKAKTLIEKNYEWGSVADGVELVYKRAGAQ